MDTITYLLWEWLYLNPDWYIFTSTYFHFSTLLYFKS